MAKETLADMGHWLKTVVPESLSPAKPVRLQRSRARGARLTSPNGLPIVCVDRTSKKWGNPIKLQLQGEKGRLLSVAAADAKIKERRQALEMFRNQLVSSQLEPWVSMRAALPELRGKNLACWCKLPGHGEIDACHAAVLLEATRDRFGSSKPSSPGRATAATRGRSDLRRPVTLQFSSDKERPMVERDRLREALKPNAEGKFDGVEVLGALSGASREEVLVRWEAIKSQHARTAACPLHVLLPTTSPRPYAQWRCGACGWEPDAGQLLAYEQGLRHGRVHESGGGRE